MPSITTGSQTVDSLLAVENQSIAEFGLEKITPIFVADLAAWNSQLQDMVADLAEVTTDRQRVYGASQESGMDEVDEFGRAPSKQTVPGAQVAFPLRKFQRNVGWTQTWFKKNSPADLARVYLGAQKAHRQRVILNIKDAMFGATNFTVYDRFVDNVQLGIKRFVNGDGAAIPNGPNGEEYDASTHTHYLARVGGAVAQSDIVSLIEHVVEHGHGESVRLYINKGQETTFRALAGTSFTAYQDPRLILGTHEDKGGQRLDISRMDNRAIGIFEAAEVWVKSWMPSNYYLAFDAGAAEKPLCLRQDEATALQGLQIMAEIGAYPLNAQVMEATLGVGVWNRTNGAILYGGDTTWADPS